MTVNGENRKYTQRERIILSEIESWDEWRSEFFWSMVNSGNQSIVFAHMAASMEAPRSMTDSVMMSGLPKIKDLPDGQREYICRAARKNGYEPRLSDAYMPTMAKKLGDPSAFFNHGDGLSKIREVCRARRCDSHGIIDVNEYRQPESDPYQKGPKLAPKIVDRIRKQMIKSNPDLARKPVREVNEMIVEKHGSKNKKGSK